MTHAAAQRIVAVALAAVPLALAGCQSDPAAESGDRPGVIVPAKGSPSASADASPTTRRANDPVIARLESVTVTESELVPLLYDAYGLDGMLKLLQRNLSRAEAARRGFTVSAADIDAERKLTLRLAFPGQDEDDFDDLLKQLLRRERVSRAEFDIVMDTNAHLRACVRGQAGTDVTAEAIRNEFNLIYGERVRVRDIPVDNPQEAAEVRRLLAEPGARFEAVAQRMGKIPELAALGGQLAEFSRTTTAWSPVFVEAAFALEPGQISDPISEKGRYHILKLEAKIAPKAVKFEAVESEVREQLIVRRTNALMAAMRQDFAQRALRELKIEEPLIRRDFDERRDAANRTVDKAEVQQYLERPVATKPAAATAPATEATPAPQPVPSAPAPATPVPAPSTPVAAPKAPTTPPTTAPASTAPAAR